jgi:3-oxoacyl-[acyl-carrier protein] reductase
MDLGLRDRVVLVTGASRGIGLGIAHTLAAEGCWIALNARNTEGLTAAQNGIAAEASLHAADVRSEAGAGALVADVVRRWGRLDAVVCNVGSGASVPPGQESEAEWRRVLDLNLLATTSTIAAARPELAKGHGDRAIVCISSICGLAALGAPVTYSAAKAALNATVRGLARPLALEGIRINAVAPGNILFEGGTWAHKLHQSPETVADMLARDVALRRFGTIEEIANIAAFLVSPRASFVTGTVVVADGGQLRA